MLRIYGMPLTGNDRHEAALRLLAQKYEALWGRSLPEIALRPDGKPFFTDGPGYFSISHTKNYVFCALSDSEVGFDAEQSRTVSRNAAEKILSADEKAVFEASEDPDRQFLQFWTLKEAYLKYTGQGVFCTDLRDFSFDVSGENPVLPGHPEVFFRSAQIGDLTLAVCSACPRQPEIFFPA